ncbi:MAG: excisionase family DNA binding protein [Verrucomicrobiales bacterium]
MQSHFATAKEVAKMLNVSPSYVYNLLRKGDLPGIRIGNCWRVDLRRLGDFVKDGRNLTVTSEALFQDRRPEPQIAEILDENQRLREIVVKQRDEIEMLQRRRA